jgi:YtkA-like
MPTRRLLGALALLAISLAACNSTSTGGGSGGSPGSDTDSLCDTDPRAETYAVGLSATSADGKMKVSFVDADPAPPDKGLNSWTMKVTDAADKPVTGASIVLVPFMPDHGHGASVDPQVKPMPSEGMYQITVIDLFMPGIWTNTFTITPTSGPAETVVFTFCVDG